MRFNNYVKNELEKCCSIQETLDKLLSCINFECTINTQKFTDNLFSSVVVANNDKNMRFLGKGNTSDASEASGLAEMIERLSSIAFPISCCKFSRHQEELLSMMRFDWIPYASHAGIKRGKFVKDSTSEFSDIIKCEYKEAYSLVLDDYIGVELDLFTLLQGSNGLASGNTKEEAFIQSCCEIFERYCLYLSVVNRTEFDTIDQQSILNSDIQSVLEYYRSLNYDVFIKDISMNVFPTVGVLFQNNNKEINDPMRYTYVCAGSFNSDIAILRCLNEKAQFGFNNKSYSYSKGLASLAEAGKWSEDLGFMKRGKVVNYKKTKSLCTNDDIQRIKELVISLGTDAVIVDMTLMGFPVVMTIIPGYSEMSRFHGGKEHVKSYVEGRNSYNFLLNYLRG